MVRAVIFDIGETLVKYDKPLNWSKLYRPALEKMVSENNITFSEDDYQNVISILTKYNTRVNPRKKEISSNEIFTEIISVTNQEIDNIELFKNSFYSFYRNEATIFEEVEGTLEKLHAREIVIGTLSDVAYGMDNKYALEDINEIIKYIQYPYTSNDIGYRKPSPVGLKLFAQKIGTDISQIMFVGDESKDIACEKNAGAISVLINRTVDKKDYGQDYTIGSLNELLEIV